VNHREKELMRSQTRVMIKIQKINVCIFLAMRLKNNAGSLIFLISVMPRVFTLVSGIIGCVLGPGFKFEFF
jgi:uncharacterized membrane protein (DUF106 family)